MVLGGMETGLLAGLGLMTGLFFISWAGNTNLVIPHPWVGLVGGYYKHVATRS